MRKRQVSMRQLEILLEFAETHREIALGRFSGGPLGHQTAQREWDYVANSLNSIGEGATKTGAEWRRYWIEMKAKTKTKAADSRRSASGTGGGPSKLMPLSDIELRILALIGPVAVEGLPGVRIPLDLPLEDTTPVASTSSASIGGESQVIGHPQMEVEWLDEDPPPIEQITSEPIVPPQSPQPSPPPPPPPPPPRSPPPPSPLPHSAETAAPQQDRISERERLPRRRHIQDAQVPRWVRDIEEKRVAAEERLASSVERLASNAEQVVFNIGALQTMLDARLSAIQDAITSLQK